MKEQLLTTLENSKNYSLAVATAMPEDQFDSKPTKKGWTFAEQLNHIGFGIRWWESNLIRKVEMEWNPPALTNTKKDVLQYLQASYDVLKETVETIELTTEAVQGGN